MRVNNSKNYVRTTTVNEFKITKLDTTQFWLQINCDDCKEGEKEKEFLKGNCFKLKTPDTIHIYEDGKISKVNLKSIYFGKKLKYIYLDKDGEEHKLGDFNLIEAQKWSDGTKHLSKTLNGGVWKKITIDNKTRYYRKDIGLKTYLITPFSGGSNKVFKYKNGDLDFALFEDTSREYFNPEAFATVIGALAEVNYIDLISNGSVGTDGTGAYSLTHFNGFNMDFKYLRKDKKKGGIDAGVVRILVSDEKLDVTRQNKFLDALYKFGWGVTEKNLSNNTSEGNDLNHCKPDAHHTNHLHIQGFKPNYK